MKPRHFHFEEEWTLHSLITKAYENKTIHERIHLEWRFVPKTVVVQVPFEDRILKFHQQQSNQEAASVAISATGTSLYEQHHEKKSELGEEKPTMAIKDRLDRSSLNPIKVSRSLCRC